MDFQRICFRLIFTFLLLAGVSVFLFPYAAAAETAMEAFVPEIESGTGNLSRLNLPPANAKTSDTGPATRNADTAAFSLSYHTDTISVDSPGPVTFHAVIHNTGNVPLSGLRIFGNVPTAFTGPDNDIRRPGVLDPDETWTYSGEYLVTQAVIDGNGANEDNTIDGDGNINSRIAVEFAETAASQERAAVVDVIYNPSYTVSKDTPVVSADAPGLITYTVVIKNTGNVSLTGFEFSDPMCDGKTKNDLPDDFSPRGDTANPGILDVGEEWIFACDCSVTQQMIDNNGTDRQRLYGGDDPAADATRFENQQKYTGTGVIENRVFVDFAETDPPREAMATVPVIRNPDFTVSQKPSTASLDEPEPIDFIVEIQNTGNVSLSGITLANPLIDEWKGPEGDTGNPGVLDVGETWTFSGSYDVVQEVITAGGVDANNVIDGDGDIDSTVMVGFAETGPPLTAHAAVVTDLSITGDIFEKKHRYFHGFLSANRSYISNLYKTDSAPESCWATFLTPGIWATFPSNMKRSVEIITQNASPGGLAIDPFNPSHFRRFQAYILYSPQLEIYHDANIKAYQDPDLGAGIIEDDEIDDAEETIQEFTGRDSLNRLTHRVDAMLHYHSGNMLSVRAVDQYKISYDAFSERAYRTDDKYTSNVFNIAGTLDPTDRLQLRLDYSKFCLDYEDEFNRDADRTDDSYAAYLFFRLTGKTSIFLEYDFADIDYDTSTKDSHEHRYFAGLRWEMTGKSSGQIKGGFGKKKIDDSPMIDTDVALSDISSDNWMAAIQIDHNFTEKTNLTLNAYRRYDEVLEHRYDFGIFDDFYADYSLAHFAGLKLSWNIVSNIHLNLDTSLFYDEFKGSRRRDRDEEIKEREDLEFAISPSITIELLDHLSVNGAYIYTDHDSNYPEHDYFDHTVFVRASLFL